MKKSLQELRKEHKMAVNSASRNSVNSNMNSLVATQLENNVSRGQKNQT